MLIAIVLRELAFRRAGVLPSCEFFADCRSLARICEYLLFSFFLSFASAAFCYAVDTLLQRIER